MLHCLNLASTARPEPGNRTEIGACLCFKDSAAYLEEWLLFHYVQGIRRFYLYDNESSDDWKSVLRPWVEAGLVEVRSYPGRGVQREIYDDCLLRARGQVTWLAFIDDDEFLFPARDGETLSQVLGEFETAAGVAVPWVLFGSSGAQNATDKWVIERFQRSAGGPDQHVKCIVRPDRVERSLCIGHAFLPSGEREIVDEKGQSVTSAKVSNPSAERLRINHYLVKSWAEWRTRRGRPQADSGRPTEHAESSWRAWDAAWSSAEDYAACRYIAEMKMLRQTMVV